MSKERSDNNANERFPYISLETDALLPLIAVGNEQAFAELYKRYHRKLRHFVQKRTGSFEHSDSDILQEVFFRVWINRDRLHEIENFNAWVYKVVATECLTLIKKELHQQTKKERLEQFHKSHPTSTATYRHGELTEIKRIVGDVIETMPEQRKKIYTLSRENGLTPNQIAEQLRIALPTVYNTLSSALKQIRSALIAAGYETHLLVLLLLELI